jgi:hypothetical protein
MWTRLHKNSEPQPLRELASTLQDMLLPSYIQSYSASSANVTISAPLGLSMVLVQSHPPQPALRSSAQLWPLALARLSLQDSYASDHVFLFPSLWPVLSQHAPLIPPRGSRSSSPSLPPSPVSLTWSIVEFWLCC